MPLDCVTSDVELSMRVAALGAILVALVFAAPAQAQHGPITTVPKVGTGTASASGSGARVYTATMENTFEPATIKPARHSRIGPC